MAETVGQHSVAAFTSPVNGTSPIDANTVKGNDNTIRSAYVDHDADPGIHVQSSTLASRPVANSAGRKWMTQDSGVIRLFYDDGTSWYEVDYLRTTGGTISGNLSITGTLAVTGVATFTAQPILSSLTASRAVFTDGSKGLVSNAITGTGDVVMSASPTLTGTITAAAATLSGTLGVSGLLTFASLKGTGATTVTNILDEDNMASDSATALATQQSIKAYVDAQVGASDALSEVLAIGNTTGANDIIVSAGQKIRTPAVAAQDGSSAITIANTTGALTLATALADSNLATISTAGKVSNSATTATDANTASAIVARDASGNFTAGTITAALTGNASTATTLQTARNINGVSFNGSADITVTAAAGTLTGTTLASNVTASSLTSVGTLANLTVTNPITGSVTGSSGSTTGNAATATALQTARNINGVSFNGTADITVTAAAGTLTGTTLASGVTASSLTSVGTLTSLTVSGGATFASSTGNVGIGTTSPVDTDGFGKVLDIRSATGGQILIRDSDDTANFARFAYDGTDNSGWVEATGTGSSLRFRTAGSQKMLLDASGNLAVDTNTLYVDAANNRVGVGTASPGFRSTIQHNFPATFSNAAGDYAFMVQDDAPENWLGVAGQTSGDKWVGLITNGSPAPSLVFGTGGFEKMRLDASGNLGLGVTPSAWNTYRALDISGGGAFISANNAAEIWSNAFFDGAVKYKANGFATRYHGNTSGAHAWYIAGNNTSGAGAALSFTQAMTLDASGNLLVGGTSQFNSSKACVVGSISSATGGVDGTYTPMLFGAYSSATSQASAIAVSMSSVGTQCGFQFQVSSGTDANRTVAYQLNRTQHIWSVGGTEAARITSGGEFLVNATATVNASIASVVGTASTNVLALKNGDNGNYFLYCASTANAERLRIEGDGDVYNLNGTYGTISDIRHKQDVIDAPSQWDDLKAVRFRKYRMKVEVETNPDAPYLLGVVAQELEQTSPGLVDEHPDFEEQEVTDEDGNVTTERVQVGTTKTVKSSILLMKAAVALQEAMARIEALEVEVATLKAGA